MAAMAQVVGGWEAIVARTLPDTDDAMRLLEVRDWLAGQGWFDVAQHRLNGGDFPMHWSRLVDLPLAAMILPLRPLLGAAAAEHVALVVVPLLTLLAALALVASIARRLGGEALVVPAMLGAAVAPSFAFQLSPLRIDHHGWQIVMALAATRALLAQPTRRSGMLVGLALATLLTISMEGLPIAVAITGVAALAWTVQPQRGAMLRATMLVFAAGATVLHGATRGPHFRAPACDAVAPVWLLVLGVAAAGVVALRPLDRAGVAVRLVGLAATAAAAGATLVLVAPACLAGPFATLPPLVYRVWYLAVLEGRPAWEQGAGWMAVGFALPLSGLVGAGLAWRGAHGEARWRWTMMALLLLAAIVAALAVSRAGATASALAAPAAAAWLAPALVRARRIVRTVPRLLATLAILALAAPGLLVGTAIQTLPHDRAADAPVAGRAPCSGPAAIRALGSLPPGVVFAPLDVTPALLVDTPHRAVAGSYHRGAGAIAKVIAGFTATPAVARRVILSTRADYVAACPGLAELSVYRRRAPNGLWARLERGERIAWLQPLPVRGPVLAWRVIHPLPEGRSAP